MPAEYVAKTKFGIVVRPDHFRVLAEIMLSLKDDGDALVDGQRAQGAVKKVSLEVMSNRPRQILMAKGG